jgi:cytochrome P450 / NADPH-cytochrome P450 reductase
MSIAIPQPKTYGPLGNIPQLNPNSPILSFMNLADEYGEIYRMKLPFGTLHVVSGYELAKELSDTARFGKIVDKTILNNVRAFAGDGLFTSETDDPNWKKAHNILLPSFSRTAMQGYFDKMLDLAMQLIQKWSRLNPDDHIEVPEDMTRLAMDTIGLCGFNYRFNSFYRDQPHPFVTSMVRALDESLNQAQRLDIQDKLMVKTRRQFQQDIDVMFSLVDKIIAERKAHGHEEADDLLAYMLQGKDPDTGEALDDANIRYQIITFLVAGHETTSGLLSFALYFLLNNRDKLQKGYEEVGRVLKDPVPTYTQVKNLKYIRMILDESLRLWPTAPAFNLHVKQDTLLTDRYEMKQGDRLLLLLPQLHRDPAAWGSDAHEFRPERFEDPSLIPHDAYKPFGIGQRACIGQQFALQEATLMLGLILKHFELIDHTNYQLKLMESLTIKPEGFTMQVRPRRTQTGAATIHIENRDPSKEGAALSRGPQQRSLHNTPLLVLYGSNLGTAEGIARELAEKGRQLGFLSKVATLNDYAGDLPKEGITYIVTASYNGQPPSNARRFMKWLKEVEPEALTGVRYCVFGCGDHNWPSTYQSIPIFMDEQLAAKGANRLLPVGHGDVSGDFETEVEEWSNKLWPTVMRSLDLKFDGIDAIKKSTASSLTVEVVNISVESPFAEVYPVHCATIMDNHELQRGGNGRSTRHIEIELPEGVSYLEGDHLGVFPINSDHLVERVISRFNLNGSDHVVLRTIGNHSSHLPLHRPVLIQDLLSRSVELQEPVTRAQIRELAALTVCPPHRIELEALLEAEAYRRNILEKRISMLDLLEKYEACVMTFERFLELLPPLKIRYYSISSSPRVQPNQISLTVGVVQSPGWDGRHEYRGVASNYLADRQPGESIQMFIQPPQSNFRLPEDPSTPIIMVGPGVGIAPFRGFLQARQAMKEQGISLGSAYLYFGCRDATDHVYEEELEQYQQEGIVTVYTAFSRIEGQPKTYVQHLIKQRQHEVIGLLDHGGQFYVCGDGSAMSPDVEATLKQMYQDVHGVNETRANRWLEQLGADGRYVKDVWAGRKA